MDNKHHNDPFSIAVDKALLKLSKEFGIALPKDDYVLVQLFLNKEIINLSVNSEVKKLASENEKSKQFFREALVKLTKQHNEKIKTYEKIIIGCLVTSTVAIILAVISLTSNLLGG